MAPEEAQPATSVPQSIFEVVEYAADASSAVEQPEVGELDNKAPYGWPHPDYDRSEELDISIISAAGDSKSHPPGDLRYGANCMKCHQAQGPGVGQFVIGGTMYTDDGATYDAGGVVEIGTGVGNRFGPKTHPIADKIMNWEKLFEVPIDAHGQFYATADQAAGINYAEENYYARIVGDSGWCKTPTGDVVGEDACETDDDCSALTYDVPGVCQSETGEPILKFGQPLSCATPEECEEAGATCEGASTGHVPVCDKLRNAMAIAPGGACNHCHQTSFIIRENPHL